MNDGQIVGGAIAAKPQLQRSEDFMRYCKIADPKQNYALNSAEWFHKSSVTLPVLLRIDRRTAAWCCESGGPIRREPF